MKAVSIFVLSFVCGSQAVAQAVDCEKLKNTKIPFEISTAMVGKRKLADGTEQEPKTENSRSQLYRNDDGFVVSYTMPSDGKYLGVAEFQNGLGTKVATTGVGTDFFFKRSTNYDQDIGKDFLSSRRDFVLTGNHSSTSKNNASPIEGRFSRKFSFKSEGKKFIGPCRLAFFTYGVLINDTAGENITETISTVEYFPEIKLMNVVENSTKSKNGSVYSYDLSVDSLTTAFAPFPQK